MSHLGSRARLKAKFLASFVIPSRHTKSASELESSSFLHRSGIRRSVSRRKSTNHKIEDIASPNRSSSSDDLSRQPSSTQLQQQKGVQVRPSYLLISLGTGIIVVPKLPQALSHLLAELTKSSVSILDLIGGSILLAGLLLLLHKALSFVWSRIFYNLDDIPEVRRELQDTNASIMMVYQALVDLKSEIGGLKKDMRALLMLLKRKTALLPPYDSDK